MTRPASNLNRRDFLRWSAATGAAVLLSCTPDEGPPPDRSQFGPPVSDPENLLELPEGWRYRVLFEPESRLTNGAPAPGQPDAMAAFANGANTVLVRNHEIASDEEGPPVEGEGPYDEDAGGGTTALVVNSERSVVESYVTSSGSVDNCAGGPTPWGTWLTCEETTDDDHGYVFEVLPDSEHEISRNPIRDMGRFSHEAAGVDPDTGIVYLTEDDGPASFLYRYTPDDRSGTPGSLAEGGVLEALALDEAAAAEANELDAGAGYRERWVGVDPENAKAGAEDNGAIRFVRLEGAWFAEGALWFNDTSGGPDKLGQTWRYTPATESLELFFQSGGTREMKAPDNAVVAPWGDFLFVEDAKDANRIMGVTPSGRVYELARNALNDSELTGPCFSPDGATLFVGYQDPGITFAVWGSWPQPNAARRARMARADPPAELASHLTPEVRDAARRVGISPLRAAAQVRLGAPLLG
jgi:uncharacterized protein